MALKSKLLDEKVVELEKEVLKEVQNSVCCKKLSAVIAQKSITSLSKSKLYFKNSTNCMYKTLKLKG
ncbi:hypothetical protein GOY07_03055 [Wolbachia endosymbiont of Litomosoides sigmodontis]|nr:hypothetical protein [Wolbachia endosymbiont of Litomosoides sigmodontis]QKX03141.1 hypothetical protein GOY07_03055 [Wolbachia endosymbiont of Litomosoides sigmodontis]